MRSLSASPKRKNDRNQMHPTMPPPLLDYEELRSRMERFEKTVALCLCIVPVIFSAQVLFAAFTCPVFSAMFTDFGAKLPAPTRFVLSTWRFWALIGIGVPVVAVILARRAEARFAIKFSAITGIIMFIFAQCITLSLLLPIFQLGAVAGGLK
jgi:type II secretory pathway component PulF